jgi:hypothetical protein
MLYSCNLVYYNIIIGCSSTTNDRECEDEVDAFLNSYCADLAALTAAATTSPTLPPTITTTTTAITPSQCTQATLTTTVTPSCTNSATPGGTSFQVTIPIIPDFENSGDQSPLTTGEIDNVPILILGALLGLSVLLLAVVSTGWVCTCLIVKKREISLSSAYKG